MTTSVVTSQCTAYGGTVAEASHNVAYPGNNALGNTLVCCVTTGNTDTISVPTDTQGNTWVSAPTGGVITFGSHPMLCFYVGSCKAGANTVTVAITPTNRLISATFFEITGDGTLDIHPAGTTGNSGTATGPAISGAAAGDEWITFLGQGGTTAGTVPAGFSHQAANAITSSSANEIDGAYVDNNATTTATPAWTLTSTVWGVFTLTFSPTAAGGAVTIVPQRTLRGVGI